MDDFLACYGTDSASLIIEQAVTRLVQLEGERQLVFELRLIAERLKAQLVKTAKQ